MAATGSSLRKFHVGFGYFILAAFTMTTIGGLYNKYII